MWQDLQLPEQLERAAIVKTMAGSTVARQLERAAIAKAMAGFPAGPGRNRQYPHRCSVLYLPSTGQNA